MGRSVLFVISAYNRGGDIHRFVNTTDVLHLGDFVYEVVWYPEDRTQGYYSRKLRDVVR